MGQKKTKEKEGFEDDRDNKDVDKRKEDNRNVVKAGFEIAIDRLRATMQYETTIDLYDVENHIVHQDASSADESTDIGGDFEFQKEQRKIVEFRKSVLKSEIESLHNQVFTAAGYIPWLERNSFKLPQDRKLFDGEGNEDERITNYKLKDLVLHETLWTVAEQVRHCPQRLNAIFYEIRTNTNQINDFYLNDNALFEFFLQHNKYCDIFNAISTWREKYKQDIRPPQFDVENVKVGIDNFLQSEINFDDIDDCGKWNKDVPMKTFTEVPGIMVAFLVLKYNTNWIQLKLWNFALILFLYMFGVKEFFFVFLGMENSETLLGDKKI